jgi:hypothetical protein
LFASFSTDQEFWGSDHKESPGDGILIANYADDLDDQRGRGE